MVTFTLSIWVLSWAVMLAFCCILESYLWEWKRQLFFFWEHIFIQKQEKGEKKKELEKNLRKKYCDILWYKHNLFGLFSHVLCSTFCHSPVLLLVCHASWCSFCFQGMHNCLLSLILRYTPHLFPVSAKPITSCSACNNFFQSVFLNVSTTCWAENGEVVDGRQ